MRRGRWQRRAALAGALTGALALAACSSAGESYLQRLGGFVRQTITGPEAPEAPRRELSRAELNEIPFATITVSVAGGRRVVLVPLVDNDGYLDYRDSSQRGVRMKGGAVTATSGLVFDLNAVRFDSADPIANQTPLTEWPDRVYREYQYRERHGQPYGITLSCTYQQVARETIEIVEILFDVVRVSEVCTNQRRQVTNTYWVDAESGFIWKSEQWVSPRLGSLTIEIIRPYAG